MLRITELCKSFSGKTVAENISFQLEPGRILAVLGQSGCGKSTLLKMIAGLETPDSGNIMLNGLDITHTPPEKRNISLMFQDYALFPHLTAAENVAFGLKLRGVSQAEAMQRAEKALAEVGLQNESRRRPEKLSGGEQQRTALARALITNPRLLLLDEAFSGLDMHLRHLLRNQTTARIRQLSIPALMVTHDAEEALSSADSVALMHEGRILQYGSPTEVVNRPSSLRAAELLGLDNTTEERHIPPRAIVLNHDKALPCPLLHAEQQTHGSKIIVQHSKYGPIVIRTDLHNPVFTQINNQTTLNIWVNETEIVWF